MSAILSIPAALGREWQIFRMDFDAVTTQWVLSGEETEASVAAYREGFGRWVQSLDGLPDAVRAQEIKQAFAYWRQLAREVTGHGFRVRPVLGYESERRALDKAWRARHG